jgi:hypothetical protein
MADNEERDEKDEAEESTSEEAEEKKAEEAEAAAEPEEEEEKPAKPKPAKKRAGAKGARARQAQAPQGGTSLGKSMILFVVIIGGLAAGFAILGREEQVGPPKPKWTTGQTVDVEITLVKNDRQDLACASANEIGGKHCAFEANNKAWSKGDNTDDKKVLKPYTTTDRVQFTAAGLWSEPALAPAKLPGSRFSVKCKYKVEGMLKNVSVRWESTGQWYPGNEWYAGSVSDCKLGK